MSCPAISTLSEETFQKVCLIAGVASDIPILNALSTCCGDQNVHSTPDLCFTYCNITVAADVRAWATCVGDNVDSADLQSLEVGCAGDFRGTGTTVSAAIATTWPALQFVETVVSSGSVVGVTTVGGPAAATTTTTTKTTQASLSTRTSTATVQSASSSAVVSPSATPSLVKTTSGAVAERRVSRFAAVVGLILCLSVLF